MAEAGTSTTLTLAECRPTLESGCDVTFWLLSSALAALEHGPLGLVSSRGPTRHVDQRDSRAKGGTSTTLLNIGVQPAMQLPFGSLWSPVFSPCVRLFL